jgi:hypothetical protein
LFTTADELDGGHAADLVLPRSFFEVINIDVDADHLVGVLDGEVIHVGYDSPAGTAPISGELEEDRLVSSFSHEGIEGSVGFGV